MGPPWALMGWALMVPAGHNFALDYLEESYWSPLGSQLALDYLDRAQCAPLGPCGPWALNCLRLSEGGTGGSIWTPLGLNGRWALMGWALADWALVAPLGTIWP